MKDNHIWQEKKENDLFVDDMVLYVESYIIILQLLKQYGIKTDIELGIYVINRLKF